MQSDDYHLDRALYYACREDRERFCSQVSSGSGRIYRCLYEQKFNNLMSAAVSDQIQAHIIIFKINILVSRRSTSTTSIGSSKCSSGCTIRSR
jgi:hypothetical protein